MPLAASENKNTVIHQTWTTVDLEDKIKYLAAWCLSRVSCSPFKSSKTVASHKNKLTEVISYSLRSINVSHLQRN